MPARRLIACDCFDRVTDVVATLHRDGYDRLGTWSLPQVCSHLATRIEWTLGEPPAGAPLPDPEGPSPDAGDDQCDRLAAAGRAMDAHPHPTLRTGGLVPVPTGESRQFHLAHANHHLSFLLPRTPRRVGLEYPDVPAAVADVVRLRGAYRRAGKWNLAQVAHHVVASLRERMRPDTDPPDTPQQIARRSIRDQVLAGNEIASGLTSPPAAAPPPDLTDDSPAGHAAVEELVAQLHRFAAWPAEFPPHRLFGRMTRDQNRRHQLVHAAHHLSHLIPVDPMTKSQNPIRSQ